MSSGTNYKPWKASDLEADKVNANAQGVSGTVIFGTPKVSIDYTLQDDCLITGLIFFTNNANYGDTVNLQVVDTSGLVAPPNTVLLQVATNWYVCPDKMIEVDFQYPAKILAGLTLRIVYTSAGTDSEQTATSVYTNYKLHKCLV